VAEIRTGPPDCDGSIPPRREEEIKECGMDFNFTEEQEMLRKTIQKFCKNELTKEKVRWMDENCNFIPDDIWNGLVDLGILGLSIPEQYGGLGLGTTERCIVSEEVATASAGVTLCFGPTLTFGAG